MGRQLTVYTIVTHWDYVVGEEEGFGRSKSLFTEHLAATTTRF
jgi:hypothetical protein